MPIFFIWSLNRHVIERVLMAVLMGFGLSAAIAGAIKLYYIRTWKYGEEAVNETVSVYMWYRVEEMSLVASACAPFLKGPIEKILSQAGGPRFRFIPPSLKSFRSGGQQWTQSSGQGVSLGSVDHGSNGAKDKRQGKVHVEGV